MFPCKQARQEHVLNGVFKGLRQGSGRGTLNRNAIDLRPLAYSEVPPCRTSAVLLCQQAIAGAANL